MRTVLITGASSGFGMALAHRLAGAGHRVFGTSRRPAGGSPPGVEMLALDVTDGDSVHACVRAVLDRAGHVDVLVNNAGYVHEGPLEELSMQELQAIFETNFFGAVRMVNAVLPSMRERRRGRIVNVGSTAGLMPLPFWGAYCATKHALESYSESLRYELAPLGVDVAIVEPAFCKTGIAGSKKRTSGAITDYDPQRTRMFAKVEREERAAPPADAVVDLLVRIVTTEGRSRLRHVVGKYTVDYWLRGVVPEWIWQRGLRLYWRLD